MRSKELKSKKPNLLDPSRVEIDIKGIFSKFLEAVTRAVTATPIGVSPSAQFAIAAAGALDKISIKAPNSERIWYLLHKSFAATIHELFQSSFEKHDLNLGDISHISTKISLAIDASDIEINPGFLKDPLKLPIVAKVRNYFSSWCTDLGINQNDLRAVAERFDSYFLFALHDEWRSNRSYYSQIEDGFNSPFRESVLIEEEWQRYKAGLQRAVNATLFGEVFSLKQIYVPLRVSYGNHIDSEDYQPYRMTVNDGMSEIMHWIDDPDTKDSITILRGGPGSGKSSLLKILASKLAEDGVHKVLFIPLQRFSLNDQLIPSVGTYLKRSGDFASNPLDQPSFNPRNGRIVLVFDGLDELTKPGELAEVEARRFLAELRATLGTLNFSQMQVLALVAGRNAIVQASRETLRAPSQRELNVVRFFETRLYFRRIGGPRNIIKEDQRITWWVKYASVKGLSTEIPTSLLRPEIEELSAEPLLLYLLVASGYHTQSIPDYFNRNSVYEKLLYGVLDRPYEVYQSESMLSNKQMAEVLEAIATAAWYGDGRTATLLDIRNKCSESISSLLDRFIKGAGIHKLIAAFYFQSAEGSKLSSDEAFEFTHKSFGEYLTARRLIRLIKTIDENLALEREFYTIKTAAKEWFLICSPAGITPELLKFVKDELALPAQAQNVSAWASVLQKMFQYYLGSGVILEDAAAQPYRVAESKMRNAEEAVLMIMSACSIAANIIAQPKWQTEHDAGNVIHRLIQQRNAGESKVALSLSHVNFDGQSMMNQSFAGMIANGSSFRYANLFASDLRSASFISANLEKADLSSCWIDRASFTCANLISCNFNQVQQMQCHNVGQAEAVEVADDYDADAENSRVVSFKEADLTGASFIHANLIGASFSSAILKNVDFRGAFLHNATFSDVDLSSCNFEGSLMYEVDARKVKEMGGDVSGICTSVLPSIFYGFDVPDNIFQDEEEEDEISEL